MQQCCQYGSVRGASGNWRPYRDKTLSGRHFEVRCDTESLFLLGFSDEEFLAALVMAGSGPFFNKLLIGTSQESAQFSIRCMEPRTNSWCQTPTMRRVPTFSVISVLVARGLGCRASQNRMKRSIVGSVRSQKCSHRAFGHCTSFQRPCFCSRGLFCSALGNRSIERRSPLRCQPGGGPSFTRPFS
jgi:hypothetical protein